MKSYIVDGKTCHFFLEQNSGGGLILNTVVELDDGTVVNYRHWYEDPATAQAAFAKVQEEIDEKRRRIARALQLGVSGKLHTDG